MVLRTVTGKIPWNLAAILFLLTVAITVTGYLYFDDQVRQMKLEKKTELMAIAELKTRQITQWLGERLADARVIHENPFTSRMKLHLMQVGEPTSTSALLDWMELLRRNYGFSTVYLLDREGNVRISVPEGKVELDATTRRLVGEALSSDRVVMSDLHRAQTEDGAHIDIITPLRDLEQKPMRHFGAVLFRVRVGESLYPMLQMWPAPSRTSESLLIRREGDEVVYLNELRHRKNTALRLRLPVSAERLPAAAGARGVQGVFEGTDYRGIAVLAAIQPVRNSTWILVAKVDQDEIYMPIRERAVLAFFVVGLTTLLAGSSIVVLWRHKQSQFYKRQYEAELGRKALAEHRDSLTKYANDIILLITPEGNILDANDQALRIYGYSLEEILRLNIRDIRAPEALDQLDTQIAEIAEGGGSVFETVHQRKDGRRIHVETSARVIETSGKKYFQAIIRDITERKRAEKALFQSKQMLEFVLDHIPQRIFWKDRDFRYLGCNKPFALDAGLTDPCQILGKHDFELSWRGTAELYRGDDRLVMETDTPKLGFEEPQSRPNGETLWLRTSKVPLHDEDGNVIGVLGTYEDITERKRMEERLAKLNEYFLEFGPDPLVNINRLVAHCGELMGATCAMYNRLEGGMLLSVGRWRVPADSDERTAAQGRICADLIEKAESGTLVIRNLGDTDYSKTDPNVKKYGLKTYIGHGVKFGEETIGSLCVLYDRDRRADPGDEKLMGILASAIGIEESRRKDRETLRETNETLNAIISSSPLSIYDLDEHGNVRKVWNPAAERMFGWKAAEVLGRPLPFISPGNHSEFWQIFGQLIHGEQLNGIDIRRTRKDGSSIDMRLFAAPIRDPRGEVCGAMALVGDVTEQKRAEAALKESEERYKRLVESSPDAVTVHSEGKLVFVNRACAEMIGAKYAEELIGKPFLDLVHQEYQDAVRARAQQTPGEERGASRAEEKFVRFDGSIIDVETVSVPITYRGKPAMQVIARDISARRQAEREIAEWKRRYELVAVASGQVVYDYDVQSGGIVWSGSVEQVLGYGPAEMQGGIAQWEELIHPEDRAEALRLLEVAEHSLTPYDVEYRYRHRDGHYVQMHDRGIFIPDENGKAVRMIGIMQDVTERKRAEEQLRQSEQKYRTIIEESKDAIFSSTVEGRLLDINPAGVEMFGFSSKEELLKVDIAHDLYFNPNDRDKSQRLVSKDGFLKDYEVELKTRDGQKLICLESSTAIRDEKGEVLGYRGILRNITHRKQTEEALRKSEAQFRQVWESAVDGMRILDQDGTIVMVNDAYCRLVGMSRDELMEKPFTVAYQASPKENEEDLEKFRRRVAERAITPRMDVEIPLHSGEPKPVELSNSILEVPGQAPQVLSIFRDITERKKAEEELKLSELRFRRVWENTMDGMRIIDESGTIVAVNEAFCRLTGKPRDELIGKPFHIIYKMESTDEIERGTQILKQRFAARTVPAHLEADTVFWDGRKVWLELSNTFLEIERGRPAVLTIFRDITERKKLSQQLVQVQKMESIGTLAAGIAHDFNNILAIILGYASMLEHSVGDSKRIASGVEAIVKSVERGAGLVRQILTFARKTEFNLESLNVNSVIGELARMLGETFPKTIRLSLQLEKDIPIISMDHTQLHQALLNLCLNARDAMSDHGSLTIATRLVQGEEISARFPVAEGRQYVMIAVSDTGKGMDETTKARIFDPFFTTKEKGKGTGLGLAVVFGVVQAHQGLIDVESEKGWGATFRIYLPVPPEAEVQGDSQQGRSQDVRGGSETILVVEDEDVLRNLVVDILREKGYTVIPAADGQDGVDLYRRHRKEIDIVVCDMGLPKFNGWELFKRIKAVEPGVSLIMASGYLECQVKTKILDSGVRGFIQKPCRPEEMLKMVRDTLDSRPR
ncbi:MAG: PAS domain S-box protein [Ignavibacteria bacterium]|nr:PAS domain S-box protein [Ignavibacteria bacterium]